jgi:hypothetical protein
MAARVLWHPLYIFTYKRHQAPVVVQTSGILKWVEATLNGQ